MRTPDARDHWAEQHSILSAFEWALGRETHVLSERPNLLWQQLYNRLHWNVEPLPTLVSTARSRHDTHSAKPWLRLCAPLPESSAYIRTLQGHSGEVRTCAFSRDNRLLASGGDDATVRLWDVLTGEQVAVLRAPAGQAQASIFNPDGRPTGEQAAVLREHTSPVQACAFSPDGQLLASGSEVDYSHSDQEESNHDPWTTRVWDVQTGELVAGMATGSVSACVFHPNGRILAVASTTYRSIALWDLERGEVRAVLETPASLVLACAFSPDGRTLVSTGDDDLVRLWDVASGKERAALRGHSGWVVTCACSPDGKTIASGGWDGTLRLRDVASGKERATLREAHPLRACAFSPDGQFVASATAGRTITLWDMQTRKVHAVLVGHADAVTACAFSPDGRRLASASLDSTIMLWDARRARENNQTTSVRHSGGVTACVYNPDGATIASTSSDSTLRLSEAESGRELVTLFRDVDGTGEGGWPINACAFSPDGRLVASTLQSTEVVILNVARRRPYAALRTLRYYIGSVDTLAFSPDGRLLAYGAYGGGTSDPVTLVVLNTVRVIRKVRTFRQIRAGPVHACAFSPNGRVLASGGEDRTVKLWDASSGKHVRTLVGHANRVLSVAFSPDGRLLASVGDDATVRLWDVTSGEESAVLRGHTGPVQACAFSPDGRLLASVGDDATLRLWDLHTLASIAAFSVPSALTCVAAHPWRCTFVCGGTDGAVYQLAVEGIPEGLPILTPRDYGSGPIVLCPICHHEIVVVPGQSPNVIECLQPECSGRVRINPFVVKMARKSLQPMRHVPSSERP